MVDNPRRATVNYYYFLQVMFTNFIKLSSNGDIVYIAVSRHSGSQSRKGSKDLKVHFW